MKRLIAFIFVVVCLIMGKTEKREILDFDDIEKVVIVSTCEISEWESFISGDDFYTTITENYAQFFEDLHRLDSIKGINVYFNKTKSLAYFKDKLDHLGDESNVEDYKVYQGYTHKYKDFNWLKGKKINCQLIETDECWILGFPLVLTGF